MLHHLDRGSSAPALVFVHGLGGRLQTWSHQVESLSATHRCIAVDLPGHGQSAPPGQPTIAALAAAVNELLEQRGCERYVLVAHSMGCRVASEAFHRSPHRCAGIVYLDGSLYAGDPQDNFKRFEPYIQKSIATAARRGLDSATQVGLWLDFMRWDVERAAAVLRHVTVPVLAVQATVHREGIRRAPIAPGQLTPWLNLLADAAGDLTIERVHGAGHFVMRDAPEATNDLIRQFLRRITPDAVCEEGAAG